MRSPEAIALYAVLKPPDGFSDSVAQPLPDVVGEDRRESRRQRLLDAAVDNFRKFREAIEKAANDRMTYREQCAFLREKAAELTQPPHPAGGAA